MPTKVKLGRDQTLTLDGVALEGVRELDLDIGMTTHDVTAWWHGWKSTLPVAGDVSVKVLIYWKDNYDDFHAKLNVHPPQEMKLGIGNFGLVPCVPTKVTIKQPIAGVLAWEVELKLWTYGT